MAYALITGASSGLGTALARRCASAGWDLVLVARREDALRDLARELTEGSATASQTVADKSAEGPAKAPRTVADKSAEGPATAPRIHIVPLDLTREDALDRLEEALRTAGIELPEITLLINNAGVGDHGPFTELSRERMEATIALNVAAVTRLVHRFAPVMPRGGTICTVASVAAFTPGPLMAVYYASKAYALSLGESLHEELRPRGIRVVTVCPGPFNSEFHAAAGIGAAAGLPSADQVAERVLAAVRRGRVVAPVGWGATVWAVVGPRLPRALSRRIMHFLQSRR